MKTTITHDLYKMVFCSLFLLISFSGFAQLSGNYTIDPTRSASSSNYRNWASAVGDLLNGSRTDGGSAQGPGVSSAVTISVYDTLYDNTAIDLSAITGASYSNRITFKSQKGDSAKCTVRYPTGSSSTNDFVLNINGADYVTFQQIGFERSGSNAYSNVLVITNDADNNRFIRCFFKGKKQPSNSTLGFANGPGSTVYYTGNGDSTLFSGNEIMYGYNGIFSTSGSSAVTITGNRIDTSGSSGIYMTGQTSLQILGNAINMGDFGPGKGHYTSYGFRIETSPSLLAANNKIVMSAVNGQVVRAIVIASLTSSAGAPAMVYNNMIVNMGGTTECTGFAVYGTYYLNIMYNNVLIVNSLTNASGYYHYAAYANSNIRILNNNFVNKGGGYAINVPGTNTSDIDSLNYNNYYSNGNYIGNWNATNYSTFSAWQSGTGRDGNSLNFDPGFTSNSNLHVSNIKINGVALKDSRITTDIDGEARDNTSPDIGADEFFPANLDLGVANLDSPLLFCAGRRNVKITFQNYGYDTVKSADIHWQINGSSQTTYTWTGTLPPGGSSASINLGPYTFSGNTVYSFRIWTRQPNGKSDQKNINDTLKISRLAAMAGKYTIGDTSIANYKSFNEGITAMTSRGICGAITFDVFPGRYTEQLTLVQLPGMGQSNPIIFQNIGKDSTKVLMTLAATLATGSNNAAVQLRGANYITFKGISFERTGTSTYIGHVIHILNGAHHNTFSNCQMLGLLNGTTQAYNIWSDGSKDDYNTFKNNYIRFGYNNMQYLGVAATPREIGTVIEGNIFESAINSSVFIQYGDSITVKGNIFRNVNTHVIGNYDIQLNDCDNGINVNGNHFRSNNTDTSLWLIGCNAPSSSHGIVANNTAIRPNGKAIFLDGVDYHDVVFNTLYFNTGVTSSSAITTSAASSNNVVFKNNLIVMDGGIGFNVTNPSAVTASDFNNFVIKGGQFAYWGAACNSLNSLVSTSGKDAKSTTIDPLFLSGSDLHIKNYMLKGKAQPIAKVTTDFDGETRHTTTPDIGADEFKLTPNDAGMVNVIKPTSSDCAGVLDVSVVLRNYGGDDLKSATITWTVNGVSQTPYKWTGNLKTFTNDTFVVGTYNFIAAFNPRFTVKATLPNGQSDGIGFNDSVIVTRTLRALPNTNLGPDITICSGDSAILGAGPAANHTYKWMSLSGSSLGTSSILRVKPSAKTSYVLEVVNTSFGCKNVDTIVVSLNQRPTANAGKDQNICPGATAQFGEAAQSGFTYSWTSIPPGFTSASANPTDQPAFNTRYIVEKSITGTGCKGSDTVLIAVSTKPIPKILGTDNVCRGSKQNYFSNNVSGNDYNWKVTGGTVISGQTTNSIVVRWDSTGFGVLKLIESNAAMCQDSATYYVVVNPNPKAEFTFTGICLNSISNFKNSSTGAQTYSWSFGDGTFSSLKEPSHTFAQAISYNVTLIAKNSFGCPDTLTQLLSIEPLPVANFTAVKKPNNTVEYTNTSSVSAGNIASSFWRFGDGDTTSVKDPTHKYEFPISYSVTLCVKSLAGCESCTTKTVNLASVNYLKLPDGFTISPNPSSGTFKVSALRPVEYYEILNTTGQLLLSAKPDMRNFEINLPEEARGLYFVKVLIDGQFYNVRLLKH